MYADFVLWGDAGNRGEPAEAAALRAKGRVAHRAQAVAGRASAGCQDLPARSEKIVDYSRLEVPRDSSLVKTRTRLSSWSKNSSILYDCHKCLEFFLRLSYFIIILGITRCQMRFSGEISSVK